MSLVLADLTGSATLALAIVTFLLTVATCYIAWLTNKARSDAKGSAESAERQANAAEEQARLAREQAELVSAALPVDYRAVLLAGPEAASPEKKYVFLELEWRGAAVTLDKVEQLRGAGINADGTLAEEAYYAVTDPPSGGEYVGVAPRPLRLANPGTLPRPLKWGEKVDFIWPGPQPGPGGFDGAVRVNYHVGSGPSAHLDRDVNIPGYAGFRYGD